MFRSDSSIVRYETIPPSHNCAKHRPARCQAPGKGSRRRSSRTPDAPATEESRNRAAGERNDG